jgi:uncharacterized protein (DUF2236 family)
MDQDGTIQRSTTKGPAMSHFVQHGSVVRRIWGKADTILLIFAGAAAEFALNKAVDWLYFTGRLPADPLGRLISTVGYARAIVFSEEKAALRAIDAMTSAHGAVEQARGARIPDHAYRDVLFMLIHYSISAYELLERELHQAEKEEVFSVFHRMGSRMGIAGLPASYSAFQHMREEHMEKHLQRSGFTDDLYRQYRKHLGPVRYWILRGVQGRLVPERLRAQLGIRPNAIINLLIGLYVLVRTHGMDRPVRQLILPARYRRQLMALDERMQEGLQQ